MLVSKIADVGFGHREREQGAARVVTVSIEWTTDVGADRRPDLRPRVTMQGFADGLKSPYTRGHATAGVRA